MKFREKKKDICADLLFLSFSNFKGIQGLYTKFQAICRVLGAKINSRLFKESLEPCLTHLGNSVTVIVYIAVNYNDKYINYIKADHTSLHPVAGRIKQTQTHTYQGRYREGGNYNILRLSPPRL